MIALRHPSEPLQAALPHPGSHLYVSAMERKGAFRPFWRGILTAVVLLSATFFHLTQPPSVIAQQRDPLLAEINTHPLHLSEVYHSIESLPLGDQIDARQELSTYIEAMINEEMLFQYVLAKDFRGVKALRRQVKEMIVEHMIEQNVRAGLAVDDSEVRAYYDANPSQIRGEHVRVRSILLPTQAQCEDMLAKIDSEETFIQMATEHSLDRASAARGGDSGLLMRAEGAVHGHELEYFNMQPGEMQIFDVPEGCLVVRQVFYIRPPLPPFAAVAPELRRYLRRVKEMKRLDELFSKAREVVPIKRHYQAEVQK